jgi:pimeloyl-ACP methyl ester carboxylesterase
MQQPTRRAPDTGYAPVGELQMYFEIHGEAGTTPLLLLHGGLFDIDLQFGALLPDLSRTRRVIAVDFQGSRAHRRHRPSADQCQAGRRRRRAAAVPGGTAG